ncbi:TPA: hypothetical protein ON523_003553 [Morganella morganii]|uniref:DinB/UmuC family translesion DNA polymerase n=1 Tax=Morganella morganii TaxID=582 RepID=UPI003EBB4F83|nr:hypothetical protein [Morganella morganii]
MRCQVQITIPRNAAQTQHYAQYSRVSPANCGQRREHERTEKFYVQYVSGRTGGGYADYNSLSPALPGGGGHLTTALQLRQDRRFCRLISVWLHSYGQKGYSDSRYLHQIATLRYPVQDTRDIVRTAVSLLDAMWC